MNHYQAKSLKNDPTMKILNKFGVQRKRSNIHFHFEVPANKFMMFAFTCGLMIEEPNEFVLLKIKSRFAQSTNSKIGSSFQGSSIAYLTQFMNKIFFGDEC